MPKHHQPALLLIRGGLDYGEYLERLAAAAHERGLIPHATRAGVVELACARLGKTLGLDAPQRCRPLGSNGHGDATPPKRRRR